MRTFSVVFARGGSKGIPRKNLQDLGGLPLIAHSIRIGLSHPDIERVLVSTDDPEIAAVARNHGADVPLLRPAELAGDDSPEFSAWKHAVVQAKDLYGPFDCMISLPATSPLRSIMDVSSTLDELCRHPDCDIVVTAQPAQRNPFFNMLDRDTNGFCRLLMEGNYASGRQGAPEVFDLCTVAYAARTEFVESASNIFDGRMRMVEIPRERAIDIDDMLDLDIARFLYGRATADSSR